MPHSILLVDDDPDLRTMLDFILSRGGYTVYLAASAEQAIQSLETTIPDLFLIDVMMPGMDGFTLTEYLRARPKTAQHPILLLSARTDSESVSEGLARGANAYLTKPTSMPEIITRVREFLPEDRHS